MKIIQTFHQCNSEIFKNYMNSWKEKFEYYCFDDHDIESHITTYCDNIDNELCLAYNKLPNKINKIDLWRYIYVYMHGGLYVDVDIAALPEIRNIKFEQHNVILFKESPSLFEYVYIIPYVFTFPFSDHPRFFQYRQSIFYASKGNRYLKLLIDKIIATDPNRLL